MLKSKEEIANNSEINSQGNHPRKDSMTIVEPSEPRLRDRY